MEAALERARPLLLPRVEAWEAAPDLLADLMDALGEERATEVWGSFRAASVIAWRLRTAVGQPARRDPAGLARPLRSRSTPATCGASRWWPTSRRWPWSAPRCSRPRPRRARHELRLKRAAEAVAGSLEPDEVHRRVVDHAASVTGASKALLTRLDSRARELRVVASVDFSLGEDGGRLSLDGRSRGPRWRARARAVLLRSADAEGADGRHDARRGHRLLHARPARARARASTACCRVAHEDPDRFWQDDLELLVQLARSSAAAIANAIDFERERRIARALTLGFVPESLPGAARATRPGCSTRPPPGEPTGGDLYGIWRLPGGEVALLVGDVAGKGVETAALSAMVRFFVEARSWDESSPAAVLTQANSMLDGRLPSRQLRDRVPGRPLRGLAALRQRRSPPAADRGRAARSAASTARDLPLGRGRARRATRSPSWPSTTASCSSPTRTG